MTAKDYTTINFPAGTMKPTKRKVIERYPINVQRNSKDF